MPRAPGPGSEDGCGRRAGPDRARKARGARQSGGRAAGTGAAARGEAVGSRGRAVSAIGAPPAGRPGGAGVAGARPAPLAERGGSNQGRGGGRKGADCGQIALAAQARGPHPAAAAAAMAILAQGAVQAPPLPRVFYGAPRRGTPCPAAGSAKNARAGATTGARSAAPDASRCMPAARTGRARTARASSAGSPPARRPLLFCGKRLEVGKLGPERLDLHQSLQVGYLPREARNFRVL